MGQRPPLKGVVVLDLSQNLPGPYSTLLLSDLGARVIKVEPPSGDTTRGFGKKNKTHGGTDLFHALNRGKLSVMLDLKNPKDKNRFLEDLVPLADVIVESFRPGVLQSLGIELEQLREKNKKLVTCSITGYGGSGGSSDAGHDVNFLARAGVLSLSSEPSLPPTQIADLLGGAWPAALQIVALVMRSREDGGEGGHIDVSMFDGALASIPLQTAQALSSPSVPISRGSHMLHGALAAYNVYRTRDGGALAVGSLEPKFWTRVVATLQLEPQDQWVMRGYDPSTMPTSQEKLRELFASKTAGEWMEVFKGVDACVNEVVSVSMAVQDPLARSRGMIVNINGDPCTPVVGTPLNMTGLGEKPTGAGPRLGEHNEQLLAQGDRSTQMLRGLPRARL